jgi:hypothetical protein
LPVFDQQHVPAVLTVYAPVSGRVLSLDSGFEPVGREAHKLVEAEWLARSTADSLQRIDRGSLREREILASTLVRFELLLREARRAAAWEHPSPITSRDERSARVELRAAGPRAELTSALESAGLDDVATAARVHVGLLAERAGRSAPEVAEPSALVRLRGLGQPHYFHGELRGTGPRIQERPSSMPRMSFLERDGAGQLALAALAAPVCIVGLLFAATRSRMLGAIALVLIAVGLVGANVQVLGGWPL